MNVVGVSCTFVVSLQIFESLALIALQPIQSVLIDEEMKWTYLIAKNQEKATAHEISRLINSKAKSGITFNALKIFYELTDKYCPEESLIHSGNALNIPKAVVKLLIEEKEDRYIVEICLEVACNLLTLPKWKTNFKQVSRNLVTCGINTYHGNLYLR
jgi:hypothetical protein